MQDSEMCPKCKSTQVIKRARIADRGHGNATTDLCVELYENPDAMIFKGTRRVPLRAWVCGSCGYTELYVDNPEDLWDFYDRFGPTGRG